MRRLRHAPGVEGADVVIAHIRIDHHRRRGGAAGEQAVHVAQAEIFGLTILQHLQPDRRHGGANGNVFLGY